MHLFKYKILKSAIQKPVDNEYLRLIYRQLNHSEIEELLIIRQKENVEIFVVGTSPERCQGKLKQIFNIGSDHSAKENLDQLAYRDALRYFLELVIGIHSGVPADPKQLLHIKEEYNLALDEGSIGTFLSNMYREGEKLGNMLQTDPVIMKNCISYHDVLLDIASKISGDLSAFQFVFLGSEMETMNQVISSIRRGEDIKIYYHHEDFAEAYRMGLSLGCIPIDTVQLLNILKRSTVFIDFSVSESSIMDEMSKVIRDCRNRLYIYFNLSNKKIKKNMPKLSNLFIQTRGQVRGLIELHTQNRIEFLQTLDNKIEHAVNRFYDWLYSEDRFVFENMVSADRRMQKVFELTRRIAPSDVSVLISGETGTGKELIARALHNGSHRAEREFVAVNCSAIPDTLLESELFGYEKGAFTGAYTSKKGLIELASRGTLFLDEIGDLPPIIQVKLLRVLQEREILRLGDTRPIKVDIRLVTATNHDLEEMTIQGEFRSDLYYRINTVQINLPPIRDRREDVPILTKFFISRLNRKSNKYISRISESVQEKFAGYDWPGNIRELENIIERAFAVSIGEEITVSDLPKRMQEFTGTHYVFPNNKDVPVESLKELEAARIRDLLVNKNITLSESARILGIGRTTLWRKMREYGINKDATI